MEHKTLLLKWELQKKTAEAGHFSPRVVLIGGTVRTDRDCKMALCRLLGQNGEVGGDR